MCWNCIRRRSRNSSELSPIFVVQYRGKIHNVLGKLVDVLRGGGGRGRVSMAATSETTHSRGPEIEKKNLQSVGNGISLFPFP